MKYIILVVEDEEIHRKTLGRFLSKHGYETLLASSAEEALQLLEKHSPDLALIDIKLPGMSGIELLEQLKKQKLLFPAIVMTAYASVETAIEALRLGAQDYITKPFKMSELEIILEKILKTTKIKEHLSYIQASQGAAYGFENIIGESPQMLKMFGIMKKITNESISTVLILGESGTGKELIASAIHYNGLRKDGPFVEINCTAIPETLLEAELFGYEKGAFTDAKKLKKGLIEIADTGTVFFDEIGHTSPNLQLKLLKIIEEKKFRRVGGTREKDVDVRIITATSRNLQEAIKERDFREDLYYRLNVLTLYLPPLRERGDDIILIANYYINHFNKEYNKLVKGLSPKAKQILLEYHWPGNVRELRNIMERSILLGNNEIIQPSDLAIHSQQTYQKTSQKIPSTINLLNQAEKEEDSLIINFPSQGINIEDVEKELIEEALRRSAWHQLKAAKLLGLSRHTLRYRMKKYDIDINTKMQYFNRKK